MRLLSREWAEVAPHLAGREGVIGLDAVVVGSGYGGAVAALRLAEMGWHVTVLERGSEYRPGDFPNDMGLLPAHLRAPSADGRNVAGRASGLVELRAGPGLVAVVGNGLGGGSLVNAGVLMRPDADVLAQPAWPAAIRLAGDQLDEPFNQARHMLQGHTMASMAGLRKAQALSRLGAALARGAPVHPVDATIDPAHCTRCGDCASGCNVPGAKRTLRDTYLAAAADQGASLVSLATVHTLRPHDAGSEEGWVLRVLPTPEAANYRTLQEAASLVGEGGAGVDVHARLVVLAAGTFGSTELLQRSTSMPQWRGWIPPALGSRLSGNGDSLSFCTDLPEDVNAIGIGADVWQPHAARDATLVSDANVGPTITRVVDLRRHDQDGSAPPMAYRLVVEDAAIPGAIGRVFAELLAFAHVSVHLGKWQWRGPGDEASDPLAAGHFLRGPANAQRNARSRSRRTLPLLTMGHDDSSGRIVWVQGREASVPYWKSPGDLPTYEYQERVLKRACSALGGVWVPNPLWQVLPESVSSVLTGPQPPQFITTVHPLGGCVMGDDPRTSVVDDLGRMWRTDECTQPGDQARRVYDNLYVLDGSIVPTSLGCNPLLTITMLAERAMAAGQLSRGLGRAHQAPNLPPAPCPPAPPGMPLVRTEPPALTVSMDERLTCPDLSVRMEGAHDKTPLAADATLQFVAPATSTAPSDWLDLWDDHRHRVTVKGEVRFERHGQPATAPRALYEVVQDSSHAELMAPAWRPWVDRLPVPLQRGLLAFIAVTRLGLPLSRSFLTWAILRVGVPPRDAPARAKPYGWDKPLDSWRHFLNLIKGWMHAREERRMRYDLLLRLRLPAPGPEWPAMLRLRGTKRVSYAARWRELALWWVRALCTREGQPLPRLRPSYVEQISHLRVTLSNAESGQRFAGPQWFRMDFKEMVGRLPLRLPSGGDLPTALVSLMAYPFFFSRFALKTHLFDFRLPDYTGRVVVDAAASEETVLRRGAAGGPVVPQALDFSVPLGVSSCDAPGTDPAQSITLRLWRYRRPANEGGLPAVRKAQWQGLRVRKVRSVLLVHAFAQSGYSFTLKTVPQNLAEALYHDGGFEVWLLEHRLSTRLAAHEQQTTLDQAARYDIPAAVNRILRTLRRELGPGAPLQMFAFAQCLGAAATSMALLKGRLSYRRYQVATANGLPPQRMPKLAGYFNSQTHPYTIGQPMTQARTWLPAFLRDALKMASVPFAVRDAQPDALSTLADRLFAALSVPEDEHCPPRSKHGLHQYGEDDCATCRRLRFIEAPLFRHANINPATHYQLPLLFGAANMRVFAHAAKCVDAERLVTEDGLHDYVTDENLHRHLALPVCFLHGQANELFHPESATRSAEQYARVHPQWANAVNAPLSPHGGTWRQRAAWIQPGYGHLDVLIADRAHTQVYPGVLRAYNAWYEQDVDRVQTATSWATVRLPLNGPFVGAVQRGGRPGQLRVSVNFRIDDRFSDGKQGPGGVVGARTWALVRVRVRQRGRRTAHAVQWHTLAINALPAPPPLAALPGAHAGEWGGNALRAASGELTINDVGAGEDLYLSCFTVHEVIGHGPPSAVDVAPLHASLPALGVPSAAWQDAGLSAWLQSLLRGRRVRLRELALDDRPAAETVSFFRLKPEAFRSRLAVVRAGAAQVLAPLNEAQAVAVNLGVGCCRYPGFRFERRRVDGWIKPLDTLMSGEPLHLGLLLGDQIYADATAGFADELNPMERHFARHQYALTRQRAGRSDPTWGDWMARQPVVMTPDDHEYTDNFPNGRRLVQSPVALRAAVQNQVGGVAEQAVRAYQQQQLAPLLVAPGAWAIQAGPTRVLVLDTRSPGVTAGPGVGGILAAPQWAALQQWLHAPQAAQHLNVIATGRVVLPGLYLDADPASPGAVDTFQSCARDRSALLHELVCARSHWGTAFKVLLLSGDYHVMTAGLIQHEAESLGAYLVAPPLYAPMPFANAAPQRVWLNEGLPFGLTLQPHSLQPGAANPELVARGSGMAWVKVERTDSGYTVRCRATLRVLEQFEGAAAANRIDFTLRL